MMLSKQLIRASLLLTCLLFTACSLNPVTGEQELLLPSKATDYQIGQSQYKPAQQSQGGAYLLDPKLSAYVATVGQKLAAVSDSPELPYEFVVLNNSVPNAWALPSGKIAINRGLLLQLKDEAQLAAVLGHEIVHAAARHGAQQMRNQQFMQLGLAGLGVALQDNDYRSLVIGGAALGAQLTSAKYSRGNELESDEYGMKYMAKAGYDLQAAVELQEIFLSLSKQGNSSWLEGLFASHPPSAERVQKNTEHVASFSPQAGYRGAQAYQNAIQYLRAKAPAYELASKAAKALTENRTNEAEQFIKQAIEIEPKEAQFHSLAGSIYQAKGNNALALAEHNKATSLNPEQFSYYLARGESLVAQGKANLALVDFEQSMSLLPTSTALSYINSLSDNKY
tara:strand:- start:22503 stop:23687 length:1185 start_codon:yes stop_codon:yes gene_type:complete